MRVALVNLTTTTQVGGVESFVLHLAHSLAARDIDVTLFGGDSTALAIIADGCIKIQRAGYLSRDTLRRFPLLRRQYGLTKLAERLSWAPGVQPAIANGGYDIAHIHKPFDFPLAAWIKRRSRVRVIYSSHGRDFFPSDRRFLHAIDALTACSAYNAREVADRYGRAPTVIYNGIDTAHFSPRTSDGGWRERLDIGNAPLILWAGRLVRWKGTIDALRAVALAGSHVHLAVAGRGPEENRLRDAATALGIAHRVHFLGTVSHADLPSLYRAADMVVGTSFANETFGMVLAEASACARPVIATAFGGFPEVVQDGETGLLVPPRDPASLANAIIALISDPERARRMGVAGRAFVTARFAWPVVTDRVLRVYREALDAD